jgi:hypothetical protein
VGDTATVSTLVTVVGQPYRPTLAGNGGFNLGLPCSSNTLATFAECECAQMLGAQAA